MKPGYAALLATPWFLSATELPRAECFTLTLASGQVLRYTNLDIPVWLNGQYFAANGVRITGLKFKQTTTADIDQQDVAIVASSADTVDGVPFLQAVRNHLLDGAILQRDRAFFNPANWPPAWPAQGAVADGYVTLFVGRVADITALGRTTVKLNVKSLMVLLDIDFPHNLWQASCLHTFGDAGCGVNRNAYQQVYTVGAGATNTVIPVALGGAGASFAVTMSGTAGAALSQVILTSPSAVNLGYTHPPTFTLSDPTGTGAVLAPLMFPQWSGWAGVSQYGLYGFVVVSPGRGYTNPTLTIAAGAAGTATAEVVLTTGQQSVASVRVVAGGAAYTAGTQLVFSGGGGQGAQASAVVSGGVITGVDLIAGGADFYGTPTLAAVDAPFTSFSQGTLMFQGGQNAGVLVQVKSASADQIMLAAPLEYTPVTGDAFTLWPGCDHTTGAGGCARYNNLANFRGFPFVPPPETAY